MKSIYTVFKPILLFLIIAFTALSFNLKAQDTISLYPKDAMVELCAASSLATKAYTNYSSHLYFTAEDGSWNGGEIWVRSYMKIDLSSLPVGAVIKKVKLYLYSSGSHHGSAISSSYKSNASWIERTAGTWYVDSITWNNQPSADTTHKVSLSNATSASQDYVLDITQLIKDIQNNPGMGDGLVMVLQNYPNGKYSNLTFYSNNYTVTGKRPRVEVIYYEPLVANAGNDTTVCSGTQITLGGYPTASKGSGTYTYSWSPTEGLSSSTVAHPTCSPTTSTDYTVKVTDSNNSTATSSKTVVVNTVPDDAGSISGPSSVCKGSTSVTYSVSAVTNANSYSWSYSGSGATISGTTNTVTIDFSKTATSGDLTVYGVNTCGNGAVSNSFPITINQAPVNVSDSGTWKSKSDIPDDITAYMGNRPSNQCLSNDSYGFNINVGEGGIYSSDYSYYNPETDKWTLFKSCPEGNLMMRELSSLIFCIGNKLYVNGGENTNFWEYNIDTKQWTQKTSLPENNYNGSTITFTIKGKGYILVYSDTNTDRTSHLWQYNPLLDTWTQKASLSVNYVGNTTFGAELNNKGYVYCPLYNSLYEYDPDLDQWKQKSNGPESFFENSSSNYTLFFAYREKLIGGFCTNGDINSCNDTLWSYNPVTDKWSVLTQYPGSARYANIGFAINNKLYWGGGANSYKDFWQYTPSQLSIKGDSVVCPKQSYTYSIDEISGATSYNWSLPEGAKITSGANTRSVTVLYSDTAQNGKIKVWAINTCGNSDTSSLSISVNKVTKITSQPAYQIVCSGDTARFTVSATGTSLAYQWQVSTDLGGTWNNIKSAAAATYKRKITGTANQTIFRCAVYGSCGTVYSDTASIGVTNSAYILTQPASQTTCSGDTASFTVEATGKGLKYQWQQYSSAVWSDISGAVDSSFLMITTSDLNNVKYRCIIKSACDSLSSTAVTLTVKSVPVITKQPSALSVCLGNDVKYSINAAGSNLAFQWQTGSNGTWTDLSGETDSVYNTYADSTLNGLYYRCLVTGACGSTLTSDSSLLTVKQLIKTQPSDVTVCSGTSVTFTIVPIAGSLTYQWQTYDSLTLTDISGATGSSYSVSTVDSLNGQKYRCVVSDSYCSEISHIAALTVNTLPKITQQPQSVTLCIGDSAGFSVVATGTDSTFQWQYSSNNSTWYAISGATNSVYAFLPGIFDNGKYFRCIVSGKCGNAVTSDTAVYRVSTKAKIITQPADISVSDGNSALFQISASGTEVSYQWQTDISGDWANISGATHDTCHITGSSGNEGYYRCVVSGVCISNDAELTVSPKTQITQQPSGITVCNGSVASFSLKATGSNLEYQWQDSTNGTWSDIDGATGNYYSLTASASNAGYYRCVVTGADDLTVYSNVVSLSLYTTLQITTQPADVSAGEGSSFTFGPVNADGTGITEQWQKSINSGTSWSSISGAASAEYSATAASSDNGYMFRCKVTDVCKSSVISSSATLTVVSLAEITTQPESQALDEGDTATFTVAATESAVTYQWQVETSEGSWSTITSASTSSYKVVTSTSTNATSYRCLVSNLAGSVSSIIAKLTLGPQVTVQLTNQKACTGSQVTFGGFTVIGKGTLTYQWQLSTNAGTTWADIDGATANSYTTTATSAMDGYLYRCKISSSSSTNVAYTDAAKLSIVNTTVLSQPVSVITCVGNDATFKVSVTGDKLRYQWMRSTDGYATWNDISGATSDSLYISEVDKSYFQNGIMCKIQGACDASSFNSNPASVNLISNNFEPLSATITAVTCQNMTSPNGAIAVDDPQGGTTPYTYSWSNGFFEKNLSNINAGKYTLTVTDSLGCKVKLTATVGYDAPVLSDMKVRDVYLSGMATGIIDPDISGGHTPLTYTWSNGTSDTIATGLKAGSYSVTVTDNKQCINTFSATVNEPPAVEYVASTDVLNPDSIKPDTSLPVGTIQGSGDVSTTGAASYTIPISVLPGIKGVEPKVSVNYNSQSGNGLLGWGWNLAASSVISRVPRTIYSDGYAQGVQIDSTDKYALDGNRLVLTNSKNYGADGSEYHTENETFSTITAHGSYNKTGPQWFEVVAKDGTTYKYGSNTGNLLYSFTRGRGAITIKAILNWYLDSVIDIHGNYMAYEYEQNNLNTYLKRITYGNNRTHKTNTHNEVIMGYAERSDSIPVHYGYVSGKINFVLNNIAVKYNDTLYRQYHFDYTVDNFSRLYKITESNGAGEKLNPTYVTWGKYTSDSIVSKELSFTPKSEPSAFGQSFADQIYEPIDINGDGKCDIVGNYTYNFFGDKAIYNWHTAETASNGNIYFNNGSFTYDGPDYNEGDIKDYRTGDMAGDINGDNKQNIIVPRYSNGYVVFNELELGSTFSQINNKLEASDEAPAYSIGDINNDGVDEIVYIEKGSNTTNTTWTYPGKIFIPLENKWINFNGPGGIDHIGSERYHDGAVFYQPSAIYIADFDGDGLKDIMVIDKSGHYIMKNNGIINDTISLSSTSIYSSDDIHFNSNYFIRMGDFNGDGLPDFIIQKKGEGSGYWYLAINNGKFGFDFKSLDISANDDPNTGKDDDKDNIIVYDFDNDGKTDVIINDAQYKWKHHWGSKWKVFNGLNSYWYKSTGTGLKLIKQTRSGNEYDAYQKYYISGDFNGDGRTELINYGYNCYTGESSRSWKMYSVPNVRNESNVVKSITNGLGQQIGYSYKPLTDKSIYSTSSNTIYDNPRSSIGKFDFYKLNRLTIPIYVVNKLTSNNGIFGMDSVKYNYEDAITGWKGKGLLGFLKITINNYTTGKSSVAETDFESTYFSAAKQNSYKYTGDTLISEVTSTFSNIVYSGVRRFNYQSQSVNTDKLNSISIKTINNYDDNGNLINQESHYNDDFYVTNKTYSGYNSFGSPSSIMSAATRSGQSEFKQTQTAGYDALGQLISSTANDVTTTYTYDVFGNPLNITKETEGLNNRAGTVAYDASGRFAVKKVNALGHASLSNYNSIGLLTSSTDANGVSIINDFDNWGNLTSSTSPDSKVTTQSVHWVTSATIEAPDYAVYYTTSKTDGVYSAEYFDLLGRSLRKVGTGFNGALFYTDTKYNAKGQVYEKDGPYPVSDPSDLKISTYTYDSYGRAATETDPNSITKTYSYSTDNVSTTLSTGDIFYISSTNKVSTTLSTGEAYSKTTDAAGLVIQATDPGGTITYDYNSMGKPFTITAPGGTVTIKYNSYGLQDTLTDPNTGTTSYGYNGFGELSSQTDARGKSSTVLYDVLGRDSVKTSNGVATKYTYDSGTKALGTLASTTRDDNASLTYTYTTDGLCRVATATRSNGTQSFTYGYQYDTKGRVSKLTYPSGFALTYTYNDYDDLLEVRKASDNSILWKLDALNAKGLLTQATYGNGKQITYGYDSKDRLNSLSVPGVIDFGYEYNNKHQLTTRKELYDVNGESKGFTETFTYDEVNRLKTAAIDGTQTLNMVYATDKIKTKSDVGEYDYNNSNHQITELDAVDGYNPPNHILTYTAEGKVDTLRDTTYHKMVTFTYGTDNERFKSEYTKHDTVQYTRYYFDTYEKELLKDGTTRNLDYIYSGDDLIAIHVNWGSADTTFFVYTDYLGSLRCITDSAGNVRQRLSFDAWGNRRNALTGAADTSIAKTLLFARGFTGHEHLDELGLINMNGRIYDPALGMFISADNYVQAPDNTQNFNRYAYCVNNPLMYSDPSGELIWIIPSIGWSKSQGVNIGVSLVVGLPGGLSVQAGIGYSFKSSDPYVYAGITAAMNTAYASYSFNNGASVGYTAGLSQFSGLPINTNFLSIGMNYNISNNNVGGNFSAWQFNENGISFDPSISVMVFPEQTTNLIRRGKFINNDAMLKSFTDVNDYQGALNYFGFEATYDPNVKNPGQFNPADNIIRLNKVAFSKNYNFLQAIYAEELFHSQDYLYAQENTPADMLSHEYEEWRAQNHLYKNQGLYSKSGIDWVQRINFWGMQAGVYDMYTPLFSPNWWHFIYKFPRKW